MRYDHYMKCPVDNTPLVISDRQNVEIDYCPTCRGVWLDRGELDKLIERSDAYSAARPSRPVAEPEYQVRDTRRHHDDDDDDYQHREYRHDNHHGKHHKKESFLGDLFDF